MSRCCDEAAHVLELVHVEVLDLAPRFRDARDLPDHSYGYNCSVVLTADSSATYAGTTWDKMAYTISGIAGPGDSGGPVFYGGTAYGTIGGGSSDTVIFVRIGASASPESSAPPVAPAPRLVLASPSALCGFAVIGGVLAVAENGCVTIGDTPAILPAGTTVAEGNDALVTDDGRAFTFGDQIDGGGGYPVAEETDEIVSAGCAEPGDVVISLGSWDGETE